MSPGARTDRDRDRASSGRPPTSEPGGNSIAGAAGADLLSTRLNTSRPREPSPFRFAEIAQRSRDRLRAFLGHDRGTVLPPRPTARAWRSSTTTTTASSTSISPPGRSCPLGTARQGSQPAVQEPGGQPLPGRDRGVGPRFRGLLPRHRGRRHRQRRRPGRLPLQLRRAIVLFLNNGDGTFEDISKDAGIGGFHWSTGGAFLDYDNDGDLDLYVTNYGQWKMPDDVQVCGKDVTCGPYCIPTFIKPARHSSTGTTETGRSPRSPRRPASVGPTAGVSGSSRPT